MSGDDWSKKWVKFILNPDLAGRDWSNKHVGFISYPGLADYRQKIKVSNFLFPAL